MNANMAIWMELTACVEWLKGQRSHWEVIGHSAAMAWWAACEVKGHSVPMAKWDLLGRLGGHSSYIGTGIEAHLMSLAPDYMNIGSDILDVLSNILDYCLISNSMAVYQTVWSVSCYDIYSSKSMSCYMLWHTIEMGLQLLIWQEYGPQKGIKIEFLSNHPFGQLFLFNKKVCPLFHKVDSIPRHLYSHQCTCSVIYKGFTYPNALFI